MSQPSKKQFTGHHISAILMAFFGTVIAVNVLMAVLAAGTFGGTVVDNSYVASQKFNDWLNRAREQEAMGWREDMRLDERRRIHLRLSGDGRAIVPHDASVRAVVRHPLGRAPERAIRFTQTGPFHYRTAAALPSGRWIVHFTIASGAHEKRLVKELR